MVSGGQTGVDRAALDAARALAVPVGGWCPAGRWAEDGPIPARYPLRETPSADPAQRTCWNVRDSDATLILSGQPLSGGTALTADAARERGRPLLIVDPVSAGPDTAVRWVERHVPTGGRLNVAGPRAREAPALAVVAREWMGVLLADLLGTPNRQAAT